MKRLVFSNIILAVVYSQASVAASDSTETPVSVGIAAAYSVGPYRDYSQKVIPLPLVVYDGSFFYLRGTETGFKLLNSESNEISLSASLFPFYFKTKEADSAELKKLNDRKLSAMAGLSWIHREDWGFTTLSAKQRITGNRKGATMAAGYGYPFQMGNTTLIVSTGVEYSTAEMNRNYFGVSPEESSRSGLRRYNPAGGFSPYVDFLLNYPLITSVDLAVGARFTRLSDDVYKSPMTDERLTSSFVASVSYQF